MIDSTRRETFTCGDCATPNMISTPLLGWCDDGSDGTLVVVVHDVSCPWLAALPEAEHYQPDEHGAAMHIVQADAESEAGR